MMFVSEIHDYRGPESVTPGRIDVFVDADWVTHGECIYGSVAAVVAYLRGDELDEVADVVAQLPNDRLVGYVVLIEMSPATMDDETVMRGLLEEVVAKLRDAGATMVFALATEAGLDLAERPAFYAENGFVQSAAQDGKPHMVVMERSLVQP